jgi:tetratricopeptide (TPR) repeat protein
MAKCLKCEYEVSGTPAFCPNCGTPMARKMSDEEISKLILSRFGKKYSEALEEAYTACMYDVEKRSLHKNLFLTRKLDALPKEGEYQDEAITRFTEKNKNDPRLKETLSHYKLGLIYENGKKLDDAGKEYGKALSALPSFASALLRRGMVYEALASARKFGIAFNSGPFLARKALSDYSQAAEADPQFPLGFFCRGLLLKKVGNKQGEALESYKKCVSLDPDCAAAHNNMGLIYVDKKDFESAEKEFSEVLRIFPGHPSGTRNLELARKKKGSSRFFR